MTEAVLLTGKRGTGKSLNAVRTMVDYMRQGRIVATNLDLFVERLLSPTSRVISYRLPDVPSAELFNHPLMPQGNPNPIDESRNGLLVLDECAGFLNSREWKDKGRTELIHFLAQSRKLGWDLLLIAQGASMIDKQVRQELCDMHGICRETSKIGIPVITWFMRTVFGVKVMMPKFYVASYYYGFGQGAVRSFVDFFRSSECQDGYNTLQKISAEFGQQGISSNLSAWHLRGRYMTRWEMYRKLIAVALLVGALVGAAGGWFARPVLLQPAPVAAFSAAPTLSTDVFVIGTLNDDTDGVRVMLSDGRVVVPEGMKKEASGMTYRVGSQWYGEKK